MKNPAAFRPAGWQSAVRQVDACRLQKCFNMFQVIAPYCAYVGVSRVLIDFPQSDLSSVVHARLALDTLGGLSSFLQFRDSAPFCWRSLRIARYNGAASAPRADCQMLTVRTWPN